ncbi:putative reverse transcriptase domain-containing protein [Tanacetum coccineum]
MNYNINRWRLASNIIGGRRGPRALSSRRRSFNERLGLTSIMSSPSHEDDHSTWTTPYMTPSTSSKMMSPEQSVGELQKTRSFPLQRTTSFPEEEDVDKKAELFIANFYRQLKMERQVSLQLRCPPILAEFVASAPLTPLLKPDNGIRPIAVGTIWRHLVSKVAMKGVGKEMSNYLGDFRFGVGVSGGAEAILHSANRVLSEYHNDGSLAMLTEDFSNAFHLVIDRHNSMRLGCGVPLFLCGWISFMGCWEIYCKRLNAGSITVKSGSIS